VLFVSERVVSFLCTLIICDPLQHTTVEREKEGFISKGY
jgi:hypothetical protein